METQAEFKGPVAFRLGLSRRLSRQLSPTDAQDGFVSVWVAQCLRNMQEYIRDKSAQKI